MTQTENKHYILLDILKDKYVSIGSYINQSKAKIDISKNTDEFMTITKDFFISRGVTVRLLCFADNSIGRSTSKFFFKGGMYLD